MVGPTQQDTIDPCLGAALPTGRIFSRITQKGPVKNMCGRTNQQHNFCQIFSKRSRKRAENFFLVLTFEMLSKRKKDCVKIYNLSLCTVSYCSQHLFLVVLQLSKILFELFKKKHRSTMIIQAVAG
jgi:hypothetical protein